VLKALIGHQVGGLPLQAAIEQPNLAPLGPSHDLTLLEAGRWPPAAVQALRERGHPLREVALPSGVQGLVRTAEGRWQGAADPRREGSVAGD
jgi:gamma-glutamyltranspeptidase/glutathione hydrolase